MKFKVGDIVGLNSAYQGGFTTSYSKRFRGRVEKILEEDLDLDGNPIIRLTRLDTTAHKTEKWSQGWLELKEVEK